MKKINIYITEKFKISKDIKVKSDKYLMFTLVARYREDKYIVPDIVEVISENGNEITFKYLTNYHGQLGKEETVKVKEESNPDEKGYTYFSDYIKSRNMVFIDKKRAEEVFPRHYSGELCWRTLLDKNYKIDKRSAFYWVYGYVDNSIKVRKGAFTKIEDMKILWDYNDYIRKMLDNL